MSNLTLEELLKALRDHDIRGEYEGLSYALTSNTTYPLNCSNAGVPWFSFFPFANWETFPSYPPISPVQKALIETITLAQPLSPQRGQVFVDFANLADVNSSFLNESTPLGSVMEAVGHYVNNLPSTVEPIIRVLVGSPSDQFTINNVNSSDTANAFFGRGLIQHPQAKLYFGFYASNLTLANQPGKSHEREALPPWIAKVWEVVKAILLAILHKLPPSIQEWIQKIIDFLKTVEAKILAIIAELVSGLAANATGWNHAKFFAVNGTTVVASGYNWWNDYKTAANSRIFDSGIKLGGDLAVSAHHFLDDIFSYLNGSHPHDTWSFSAGSPINNGTTQPNFTAAQVPIWSGSNQSSTQLPGATQVAAVSIASVTRDPTNSFFNFPTLAFNAIRDLILDILFVLGENVPDVNIDLGAVIGPLVSDDAELIKILLDGADVSPAAWSSRYGRVWAIANAKSSVKIFNQALVDKFIKDMQAVGDVNNIVSDLAAKFGRTPILWDGLIWGYDTLIALAKALANDVKVQVVAGSAPSSDGYSDAVSCQGFTTRLTQVMQTLLITKTITLPSGVTVEQRVADRFEYRHIGQGYDQHSKCVIIDDFLFYAGSDNAYPNYNDQFGAWIGDVSVRKISAQPDAGEFGYWDKLWSISSTIG